MTKKNQMYFAANPDAKHDEHLVDYHIDDIDLNYGPTGAVGSITLKGVYKDDAYAINPVSPYSGLNIRNKKLYSGSCNKYMLHALATGNSASFNPEDIMEGDEVPYIFMFTGFYIYGLHYNILNNFSNLCFKIFFIKINFI